MISSKSIKLTHCKRGHERTLENVYTDSRGKRTCKTCQALTNLRVKLKKEELRKMQSERRIPRDLKQVSI